MPVSIALIPRSKRAVIASIGIGLLAALAAIGVLVGSPTMATLALTCLLTLLSLLLVYTALAVRRVERTLRRFNRQTAKVMHSGSVGHAEIAPRFSDEDLIGTIRLLQAQYFGRLDRAQAALEEAVARLSADRPED